MVWQVPPNPAGGGIGPPKTHLGHLHPPPPRRVKAAPGTRVSLCHPCPVGAAGWWWAPGGWSVALAFCRRVFWWPWVASLWAFWSLLGFFRSLWGASPWASWGACPCPCPCPCSCPCPGPGPGPGPSPGPNPSSSPGPAGRRCQGRAGARCHRVPSTNAASRRALRLMPALPHGLGAAGLPRDESLRDGARSKPACWKLPLVWQEVRTRCFFKFFSSPNRSDSQEFWFHGYHQTWLCMSSASVHGEDSQMCDAHREKPGWELTVGKWIRTALHRQRMSILTCSSCSQHPHSEKKKIQQFVHIKYSITLKYPPLSIIVISQRKLLI